MLPILVDSNMICQFRQPNHQVLMLRKHQTRAIALILELFFLDHPRVSTCLYFLFCPPIPPCFLLMFLYIQHNSIGSDSMEWLTIFQNIYHTLIISSSRTNTSNLLWQTHYSSSAGKFQIF